MSAIFGDTYGEFADRRDKDAGESFMLTFAAIGALALFVPGKAEAAFPDVKPRGSNVAAGNLISRASPPPAALSTIADTDLSDPPTTTAAAEALALLDPSPRAGWDSIAYPGALADLEAARSDNAAVASAADVIPDFDGDNDIVAALGNDTISVPSGSTITVQGASAKAAIGALSLNGVGLVGQANGLGGTVGGLQGSQALVFGNGVSAALAGPNGNIPALLSSHVASTSSNAALVMNGNGQTTFTGDSAWLFVGDGGNLFEISTFGAAPTYLGANDFLQLSGVFNMFVGASIAVAFGDAKTTSLYQGFASTSELLGAANQVDAAISQPIDSAGDRMSLAGLDQGRLAAGSSQLS